MHMALKFQGNQKTIGCERLQVWRWWGSARGSAEKMSKPSTMKSSSLNGNQNNIYTFFINIYYERDTEVKIVLIILGNKVTMYIAF